MNSSEISHLNHFLQAHRIISIVYRHVIQRINRSVIYDTSLKNQNKGNVTSSIDQDLVFYKIKTILRTI